MLFSSRAEPSRAEPSRIFAADRRLHDFGVVAQGQVLTTQFVWSNSLASPVLINQVLKSCTCSQANVSADVVPPGQSVTLTVVWEVGMRRGVIREDVPLMFTVDHGPPQFQRVQLTASVEPDILTSIDEIEFDFGIPGRIEFDCRPGRMSDVQLSVAFSNHSSVRAGLSAVPGRVVVEYDPTATGAAEAVNLRVFVNTNSRNEPT
jgi:hypothetical protein